jgi:hypothetical protein
LHLELGVVPAVLTPDGVPEPCLEDLVGRVHHGEAPAAARGVGGEHRQQDEDAHLDEDDAAGPSVLAAVQLQVQGSVDPGDPDQGEDDGELGQPADRDMLGQMVGRLADDGHVHQVVEQLEDADLPVGDDLPMGSWRPPKPPLEAAVSLAGHGISRPPRLTSRMLDIDPDGTRRQARTSTTEGRIAKPCRAEACGGDLMAWLAEGPARWSTATPK